MVLYSSKKQKNIAKGMFMSKPRIKLIGLLLAALLPLSACGSARPSPMPEVTADPHAGEVRVTYGSAGDKWVPLFDSLPVSTLEASGFSREGEFVTYAGADAVSVPGIDVSFYQKEIDWARVADAGVKFAIIRAGYRGYSEGTLFEDSCFEANLKGALDAGLDVGLYFFSQAVNAAEARQEAEFVLGLLRGQKLALPIFFDWEHIDDPANGARTDAVSGETLTACALAFGAVIENAGYTPGVYFYRNLGYFSYDLASLRELHFWFSGAGDFSDFYYAHGYWQYSYAGTVPGIEGTVDLNLRFVPKTWITAGG